MVKIKEFPNKNYKAIFCNGKTTRLSFGKPILELDYPEFYDVALGTWCDGGCKYCYVGATEKGYQYKDVVKKIEHIFGNMNKNQRPFQCVIGGEGEPTSHSDFINVLKTFFKLGIMPNYTTYGRDISNETIQATKDYCGGVAVSLHPHLKKYWIKAIEKYSQNEILLNVHVVIYSKQTIKYFWKMYEKYQEKVDCFVMLPHMSNRNAPYEYIDLDYLEETLDSNGVNKVAMGGNFSQWLMKNNNKYNFSIYGEGFSKYLLLDDPITLYSDSHNMKQINNGVVFNIIKEYKYG